MRILSPGGQALLYVWALEQEKDKKKSNYLSEHRIEERSRNDPTYDNEAVGAGADELEGGAVWPLRNPEIEFFVGQIVRQL